MVAPFMGPFASTHVFRYATPYKIDGESQVDIVLMSLPKSFKNFHLNYSMSKGSYSLVELLKELQEVKGNPWPC